jgi:hypothetical protein
MVYGYFIVSQKKISLLLFLLIAFSFLNVFINTGYANTKVFLSFNYTNKIFCFISTLLAFYMAISFVPNKTTEKYIVRIPIILGTLFIVSYYFLGNTQIYGDGITLGFHNPNFTAMWLTHFLCYGIYAFFNTKKLYLRIGYICFSVIIGYFIFLTHARACIGGMFCFFLLLLWGLIKRSYKIPKGVILLILIFPLIFVILYIRLKYYLMYTSNFDFIVSEGKSIMSRFDVWNMTIRHFLSNWWTGDYSGISYGFGTSQMLNIYWDILASYGILPFMLFFIFLWKIVKISNERIKSFPAYISLISFLVIILTGTFEASLVAGCTGLNFLTSGFLLLSQMRNLE